MRVVMQCANEVPPMILALCDGDITGLGGYRNGIFALEKSADVIKNELRAHLPRRMFMPVDRRDLLEILDLQDSIADTAQDIAGMLVLRDMQIPKDLHEPLKQYTQRCVDACNQLGKIMEQMDELLETGFRGPESEKVMYMIDELNKIETDTDQKAADFMRLLFKHEEEIGAVGTILWTRLTHWIGDLANYAERVGNRHRLLLAR